VWERAGCAAERGGDIHARDRRYLSQVTAANPSAPAAKIVKG